ncbi:FecR family protein [Echinicola sp. 20G]|uniref:FecR family protein n=1 Tax=Echinicola sp. 20G TaxID=2781961 RepID=UPI0019106D1F|nr:FecR domain-containing protein [Echinicola sp. 20G]
MKKQFEHIEDFLEDSSFRSWVFSKGAMRSLFWETWLKDHADKADMLYEAKEILLALEEEEEDWSESGQMDLLAVINSQIDTPENNESTTRISEEYFINRPRFIWLKVSMILLVMVVGAVIIGNSGIFLGKENLQEAEIAWTSKQALPGEKKKVRLPDGSIVIMNSASELQYQTGFGETHRDIFLSGESFFEVAKDTVLPFRVYSGDLVTEAVGTAFNVTAFPEEGVRVKLVEGKVKVELQRQNEAEKDRFFLTQGEQAYVTQEAFVKGKFDMEKALLWTEGILTFDDIPFQEVVTSLERWYGVEIAVEGASSSSNKVSGEFHKDNLENVLRSIAYSFHFDFEIQEKQVFIEFN